MSDLARLQQQFVAFLQGQESAFPELIGDQPPVPTDVRLNIYHNAYRMRLRETIDNDHPILGTYLGDELYDLMVANYIDSYPSKVKSLRYFCDAIPQLLAEQAPFNQHPILSPLAAFERILLSGFDAKDAAVIGINELATLPAEQWPELTIAFHPSVRIFEESINAVETWQALKSEVHPPQPTPHPLPIYWLVWRNQERLTEFRHLPPAEMVLLKHFIEGGNFADGCELLTEYFPVDEVPAHAVQMLQNWLNSELITSF
ncbi:DNA-binding domain-containing protein [Psychrobium sp. MM17-31]|uniref:HvfC/BufC N-terminal domain-containing protein n=1 Tax=Psychrobium sp. MM17-31 TaxID=2917758 RepID=UPI001EF575F1|nr:DNA-binding domain-containing protein [Psychrobium sp. MM17-31]MCG7531028.1 DNA-binding domain-containing protein [Psychrobium sp. MM17-31]